jgi:phosphoribosylglycinamide formyltransferase-1
MCAVIVRLQARLGLLLGWASLDWAVGVEFRDDSSWKRYCRQSVLPVCAAIGSECHVMAEDRRLRLGGLVSGGGRTLLNLAEAIAAGRVRAELVVVISSRSDAGAVARCRAVGLPVEIVERRALPSAEFHRRIADILRDAGVELVCMGGFLSRWEIPNDFMGRVINIHPALLPKFGGRGFHGLHVHRAVLAAGARESGCTVHVADDEYDHGPILLQRPVPVHAEDTPEALAARVFAEECRAFPEVVQQFAGGVLPLPYPLAPRDA